MFKPKNEYRNPFMKISRKSSRQPPKSHILPVRPHLHHLPPPIIRTQHQTQPLPSLSTQQQTFHHYHHHQPSTASPILSPQPNNVVDKVTLPPLPAPSSSSSTPHTIVPSLYNQPHRSNLTIIPRQPVPALPVKASSPPKSPRTDRRIRNTAAAAST